MFVLPWIWLPMMILLVRGFRSDAIWSRRLLVWLAAPPIVVFALISAWSTHRVLYHWGAPGYLMLFPMLGDSIARRLDRVWVRAIVAGSAGLVLAAMAVIVTQLQFDWLGDALASVSYKDPTAEGLDWISVRDDLRARGLLPPGAVVASFNWRDAGKFGYALGPDTTMLCLNADSRQFGLAHPPNHFAGREVLLLSAGTSAPAVPWFLSVQDLLGTSVRLGDGRVLLIVTVLRGQGLVPQP
jgi:hypothetical protein